nr:replication protein A 70 kDa DNA-binding subunit D-like [Ipomoea batatas]
MHGHIPMNMYVSFKTHSRKGEYIMGRLVEIYSPMEKFVAGKSSRLIDFVVEDEKGERLRCTAWDDHVSKIELWFNWNFNGTVIVLLQFCRVKHDLNSKYILFRLIV